MIPENEVNLSTLATHLENSGWDVSLKDNFLFLRSEQGLAFSVSLEDDRKFVGLCTYLPLRRSFEDRLELVNTLNAKIFMASFSLVDEDNVRIVYYMSYSRGLILPQFARIVRRFAGLIDCVRCDYDPDGLVFAIGDDESEAAESEAPVLLQ